MVNHPHYSSPPPPPTGPAVLLPPHQAVHTFPSFALPASVDNHKFVTGSNLAFVSLIGLAGVGWVLLRLGEAEERRRRKRRASLVAERLMRESERASEKDGGERGNDKLLVKGDHAASITVFQRSSKSQEDGRKAPSVVRGGNLTPRRKKERAKTKANRAVNGPGSGEGTDSSQTHSTSSPTNGPHPPPNPFTPTTGSCQHIAVQTDLPPTTPPPRRRRSRPSLTIDPGALTAIVASASMRSRPHTPGLARLNNLRHYAAPDPTAGRSVTPSHSEQNRGRDEAASIDESSDASELSVWSSPSRDDSACTEPSSLNMSADGKPNPDPAKGESLDGEAAKVRLGEEELRTGGFEVPHVGWRAHEPSARTQPERRRLGVGLGLVADGGLALDVPTASFNTAQPHPVTAQHWGSPEAGGHTVVEDWQQSTMNYRCVSATPSQAYENSTPAQQRYQGSPHISPIHPSPHFLSPFPVHQQTLPSPYALSSLMTPSRPTTPSHQPFDYGTQPSPYYLSPPFHPTMLQAGMAYSSPSYIGLTSFGMPPSPYNMGPMPSPNGQSPGSPGACSPHSPTAPHTAARERKSDVGRKVSVAVTSSASGAPRSRRRNSKSGKNTQVPSPVPGLAPDHPQARRLSYSSDMPQSSDAEMLVVKLRQSLGRSKEQVKTVTVECEKNRKDLEIARWQLQCTEQSLQTERAEHIEEIRALNKRAERAEALLRLLESKQKLDAARPPSPAGTSSSRLGSPRLGTESHLPRENLSLVTQRLDVWNKASQGFSPTERSAMDVTTAASRWTSPTGNPAYSNIASVIDSRGRAALNPSQTRTPSSTTSNSGARCGSCGPSKRSPASEQAVEAVDRDIDPDSETSDTDSLIVVLTQASTDGQRGSTAHSAEARSESASEVDPTDLDLSRRSSWTIGRASASVPEDPVHERSDYVGFLPPLALVKTSVSFGELKAVNAASGVASRDPTTPIQATCAPLATNAEPSCTAVEAPPS